MKLRLVALLVVLTALGCAAPKADAPAAPDDAERPLWQPWEGNVTRIAFGSCAFQWEPQPIFRTIADTQPELYVSLGDAIYADFDGTKVIPVTEASLQREWELLAGSPDWQYLLERVPIEGTWDNHDYGHHSAGADFPLKETTKRLFLDAFGEPLDSERRRHPGLYASRIFESQGKRIQLILLDTRTFKSPQLLAERPADASGSLGKFTVDDRDGATVLGDAQWGWLYEQLGEESVDLRLIASSTQVLAQHKGMDQWSVQPRERRSLARLALQGAMHASSPTPTPTLFFSGNAHFAEVSRSDLKWRALGAVSEPAHGPEQLLDFTSSGLTHTEPAYAAAPNAARVAGPFTELNFGLIEVDWEAEVGPLVRLSAVGLDGRVGFDYVTNLAFAPVEAPTD